MGNPLFAAQMRAIETAACAAGHITGAQIMERAGRAMVEALLDFAPRLADGPHRAVVLCGPGNTGGRGFAVAWLLAKMGWQVEVSHYGQIADMPVDAQAMARRWQAHAPILRLDNPQAGAFGGAGDTAPDVIIDAVLGPELRGPLPSDIEQVLSDIQYAKERRQIWPLTAALDIPTGLDADTGQNEGEYAPSILSYDLTVGFHCARIGHLTGAGPDQCGTLLIKDIGLARWDNTQRTP